MYNKSNLKNKSEKGQIIYFVAIAFLGLLGLVSLSIDGGRIFLDRRNAQNAADTAVFAAAYAIILDENENTVGLARADDNGFDNDGTSNTVTVNYPPASGAYSGDSDYVQVVVTVTSETAFMKMFYSGDAVSTVDAVARVIGNLTTVEGMAIVTLGNCTDDGATIAISGGGNSGTIKVIGGGGVFLNSTTNCALAGSNSSGSPGIILPDITSIGPVDYSGDSGVTTGNITENYGFGKEVSDPFADAFEDPSCLTGGPFTPFSGAGPYTYNGGKYWGGVLRRTGFMNPGIYCVYSDMRLTGSNELIGDGVVIVLMDGALSISGIGGLQITAPVDSNCLGTEGDTTASCTYKGFAIYMAEGNCNDVDISGNGYTSIKGMIYAPCSTVIASGNGDTDLEGQILSKSVQNNGNGKLIIKYNGNSVPVPPPMIELVD